MSAAPHSRSVHAVWPISAMSQRPQVSHGHQLCNAGIPGHGHAVGVVRVRADHRPGLAGARVFLGLKYHLLPNTHFRSPMDRQDWRPGAILWPAAPYPHRVQKNRLLARSGESVAAHRNPRSLVTAVLQRLAGAAPVSARRVWHAAQQACPGAMPCPACGACW